MICDNLLGMAIADEQLNARVKVGTNDRLMERARLEGISKKALIGKAIEEYLTRPAPSADEAMFD